MKKIPLKDTHHLRKRRPHQPIFPLDSNYVGRNKGTLRGHITWQENLQTSRVKAGFKSVPLQFNFEIAGLASARNWQQIQNMAGEEGF